MAKSKTDYSSEISEIRSLLLQEKPAKDGVFISRYVGSVGHEKRKTDEQSQMQFLGYSLPQLRNIAKEKFSFSDKDLKVQTQIWMQLYHQTDVHDEACLALIWLTERKRRELILSMPQEILALQKRVDNWAISDAVSELVSHLLELSPEKFLPQMKKWNRSKNPWERRQSLVGLYCYARMRKKPLPAKQTLPLIENLIDDPHYFVQKAVGWTLREVYQVDKKAQLAFVEKYARQISGTAFFATAEKMSPKEKERIMKIRSRKKSK